MHVMILTNHASRFFRCACLGLALAPSIGYCGPDVGGLFRQYQDETLRRTRPESRPAIVPREPAAPEPVAPGPGGAVIRVEAFEVHGVRAVADADIAAALAPYVGKEHDAANIHQAVDALSRLYRSRGYFASRVFAPPQVVTSRIRLDVYEGYLDSPGIEVINKGSRVDTTAVQSILEQHLSGDKPIHRSDFERALLMAEDLPGVTTVSTLYPGARIGTARLRTEMFDLPQFSGNVDFDNFGARATGQNRLGATVYLNSPSGAGDQIAGRFVKAGDQSSYVYLNYLRPLSAWGTRWGASIDRFHYDTDFITNLGNATGRATDVRLYLTHPIVRARHGNLNLRTDVSHLSIDDRNGLAVDARRDIDTLTVALQGDDDHPWMKTGLTTYEVSATAGKVRIRGNAAFLAADRATAATDGGFARLNLTAARLTRWTDRWSTLVRFDGQWANANLDGSQRFYLGGPTNMAGYPSGEAGADAGTQLGIELRHDVGLPSGGTMQVGVFYQHGRARVHKSPWVGWQGSNPFLQSPFSLRSVGVQVLSTIPGGWVLRGMIGRQLGSNVLRDPVSGAASDARHASHRAWVQVIRYF